MSTAEIGPWPAPGHHRRDDDTDSLELAAVWSSHGAARQGLGRGAQLGAPRTGPVGLTDAHLARAALHDQAAFAAIYDRYADRLHDFCLGLLRDHHNAADAVQDTFCTAATRLAQLQDPEKLRPWLYAIARHESLRRLRGRGREQLSDTPPDTAAGDPSPDVLAGRNELAALITEAAGGLSDRDRTVLELHYRHGLDGPELADALGVSHSNANTLVVRLRATIDRSLGALLLARQSRRGHGRCGELATILARWDGEFTVLWRKRIARHVEGCALCQTTRGELVNPRALLGATPILVPAPQWLRAHTLAQGAVTHLPAAAGAAGTSSASAGAGEAGHVGWWAPASSTHAFSAGHALLVAPLIAAGSIGALVFGAGATTATTPVAATVPAADAPGSPGALPAAPNAPHFTFDMPTTTFAPGPPAPGVPDHPGPRPAGPRPAAPQPPAAGAPGTPSAPRGGPHVPPLGTPPPVGSAPGRTPIPDPETVNPAPDQGGGGGAAPNGDPRSATPPTPTPAPAAPTG